MSCAGWSSHPRSLAGTQSAAAVAGEASAATAGSDRSAAASRSGSRGRSGRRGRADSRSGTRRRGPSLGCHRFHHRTVTFPCNLWRRANCLRFGGHAGSLGFRSPSGSFRLGAGPFGFDLGGRRGCAHPPCPRAVAFVWSVLVSAVTFLVAAELVVNAPQLGQRRRADLLSPSWV